MSNKEKMPKGITILGLGPGNAQLLTREAWDVLNTIDELHVRTRLHPVLNDLPDNLVIHSFDSTYEAAEKFEDVYQEIVDRILDLGQKPDGVVYAVPGNPFVAEATTVEIVNRAKMLQIPVRIVNGMSFIEPAIVALHIDPLPRLMVLDALDIISKHTPSYPPDVPVLIAQIYSKQVASDLKLNLMSLYPDEHPVILVHGAGSNEQVCENVHLYEIDHSNRTGLLTVLYIPPLENHASFESFLEIVARLRAPDGCPWDREQTHSSLRPFLLEETYELIAALDDGDRAMMCEEMGDLLLQIVLHAQIASENVDFNIYDVLDGISKKLINRHPHVFAQVSVADSHEVIQNWEKIKEIERAENGKANKSLLDSVPNVLPALNQADQYQRRAARVGFDWSDIQGVYEKLLEELHEVMEAVGPDEISAEIGDLLFTVVNYSRWLDVDPESALREANQRFKKRFTTMEHIAKNRGQYLRELSLDQLNELWEIAKD
jgi:tetrapyrrole methylase family protein/MazG family protein